MTRHPLALALVVLSVTALHAQPAQTQTDDPPSAQAVVDGLSCSSFEWIADEGISDRAAMLVPVRIDGHDYRFQLDTGSDVTFLYGTEAEQRGWPVEQWWGKTARVPDVRLGGAALDAVRFSLRPETSGATIGGTVGLDVLTGHVVVIDYPRQRFCLVPSADAPYALMGRAAFVQAELRSGKFFVAASVGGEPVDGLMFDTGSSLFPLLVDGEDWRGLTGRTGTEADLDSLTVPAWGRMLTFVGAPAEGDLEIGPVRLARPTVYTEPADPTGYADFGFRARGLIGNAPFFDEVVVLDLRSRPLFGVLR